MHKKIVSVIGVLVALSALIGVAPFFGMAQTAQVQLTTSQTTVKEGAIFKVNIVIDPKGEPLDTARIVMSYPASLLAVTGFAPSGMFPSQSPGSSYNNTSGIFSWGGYSVDSPITTKATFGTVTFKAINSGNARIDVSNGTHLIAAGQDLVDSSSLGSLSMTITGARPTTPPPAPTPTPVPTPTPTPTPTPAPEPIAGLPYAPTVTSSTHPDPSKWYAANRVVLSWRLASDIIGVNFLANQVPTMDPLGPADAFASSHTYTDVKDGVWYFHINLQNDKGWGRTAHFKFQIDSSKPTDLIVTDIVPSSTGTASMTITANDGTSGIDHYSISIDGQQQEWRDDGTHKYTTPALSDGVHAITVTAFDRAGNTETTTTTVTTMGGQQLTSTPTPIVGITPAPEQKYPLTDKEIACLAGIALAAYIIIKMILWIMRLPFRGGKIKPGNMPKSSPKIPAARSKVQVKTQSQAPKQRRIISGRPAAKKPIKKAKVV